MKTNNAEIPHFNIISKSKKARVAYLQLQKGQVKTPAFMPVATLGALKACRADEAENLGADMLLANAYHLMLRPGQKIIQNIGGIHNFMQWHKPILTDSGGFQVFSLAKMRKISDEGVTFQSHIDGTKHLLSPEKSIELQKNIGSDINMVLDECLALPAKKTEVIKSAQLTLQWAHRCKQAFENDDAKMLFAIIQGGCEIDIRKKAASDLQNIGFHGYAIGGLSVGEGHSEMIKIVENTCREIDENKPRYLMGVGTPLDIIKAVQHGIDMFDCVMPARAARHGLAFTQYGKMNLRNAQYANDEKPINPKSKCKITSSYSKAYLHHLIKAKEILASMLLTHINLCYYQKLMKDIRKAIAEHKLEELIKEISEKYPQKNIAKNQKT